MPQLRKDPITFEWVIIAGERQERPHDFPKIWENGELPPYDPKCPFCPGNEHLTPPEIMAIRDGQASPNWFVRVVPNKYPALRIEGSTERRGKGMFDYMDGVGAHEVIIETPLHNARLSSLPTEQVKRVFLAYKERILDLKKDTRFVYILVFRNEGKEAGASLKHPHSQLIALPFVPHEVVLEIEGMRRYYSFRERCPFCDMVKEELSFGERVVAESENFLAFEPFASKYPFETLVLPKRHHPSFAEEPEYLLEEFASFLKDVLSRLDRALQNPPYNYTIHSIPLQGFVDGGFHWHLELIPRITTPAGFELGSGIYINPVPPEEAAKILREI
ncbi:MAG: galactose-1-phosphate uridylyltransferase [bacterium]